MIIIIKDSIPFQDAFRFLQRFTETWNFKRCRFDIISMSIRCRNDIETISKRYCIVMISLRPRFDIESTSKWDRYDYRNEVVKIILKTLFRRRFDNRNDLISMSIRCRNEVVTRSLRCNIVSISFRYRIDIVSTPYRHRIDIETMSLRWS